MTSEKHDIYYSKININNTVYVVKSCCTELDIWISICPEIDIEDFYKSSVIKHHEIIRYIYDGEIDWYKQDNNNPVILEVKSIAENIAKKQMN